MKCPHCKKEIPMPTSRQMEAFRLVHVVGVTHEEAAGVMGIARATVTQILSRLQKKMPGVFPSKVAGRKNVRYDESMSYSTIRQF